EASADPTWAIQGIAPPGRGPPGLPADALLSPPGQLLPSVRPASGAAPGHGIGASAIPIVRRHDLLLILGGFLFGEIFFARECARPFKRSNGGVRPDS